MTPTAAVLARAAALLTLAAERERHLADSTKLPAEYEAHAEVCLALARAMRQEAPHAGE